MIPYNLKPHLSFEIWESTKLKLMTSSQPGTVCGNGEVAPHQRLQITPVFQLLAVSKEFISNLFKNVVKLKFSKK